MTLIDFADKRTEFPALAPNEVYPGHAPALNFIDAILGHAPNGSSGELGLASMEIIEAACDSAEANQRKTIRPCATIEPRRSTTSELCAVAPAHE
jgi:predicted dehydrogenase